MSGDDSGNGRSDLETLRVTREESRDVLDHQLSLLNDLDDKAMRTVRTAVLLLGILISAAGIAGPERLADLHPLVKWLSGTAALLLFVTSIIGTATYIASDMTFGVGRSHRAEIRSENYSEREWLFVLLDEYDKWTGEMRRTNESNARNLQAAQFLLALSLALLLGAATLLTWTVNL